MPIIKIWISQKLSQHILPDTMDIHFFITENCCDLGYTIIRIIIQFVLYNIFVLDGAEKKKVEKNKSYCFFSQFFGKKGKKT